MTPETELHNQRGETMSSMFDNIIQQCRVAQCELKQPVRHSKHWLEKKMRGNAYAIAGELGLIMEQLGLATRTD